MEFVKFTFLIISFALTDSAPAIDSNDVNFAKKLDSPIACYILKMTEQFDRYETFFKTNNMTRKSREQSNNEKLYNVTTTFLRVHPSKVELTSNDKDSFKILGQLSSVYLEGYLRDSHHHIVTEKISVNYVVESTIQNGIEVDYPNFDSNDIKLFASDYQYKPNEENQIKKEIETSIKAILKDVVMNRTLIWKASKTCSLFDKISYNDQERRYFVDAIPSTNYTLKNVTINGSWNVQSTSFNFSNPAAFVEIEIRNVDGSMVRNFPSMSEELSFKADRIYISGDRNTLKVNVKAKEYSVTNVKLNATLADDQSKFIIGEIETAFAVSLESAWKTSTRQRQA